MNTVEAPVHPCPYCGAYHSTICPMVKALEYHGDGTLKRVEFKTAADYPAASMLGGQNYRPVISPNDC